MNKQTQDINPALVWAFKPIDELHGETGFVECPTYLAEDLIESGMVQDPRVGALHLKEIEDVAPVKQKVIRKKATRRKVIDPKDTLTK